MADEPADLELKFDGAPVHSLDGAPADAVASSLVALQRMVHIIGMCAEGRALGERLKPTASVRRDYTIVCRAPKKGSHIQPFGLGSSHTHVAPTAAAAARNKLLGVLNAMNSGDDKKLIAEIPNPRERWFLAKAAAGLIPDEQSGLKVMIRAGSRGPFAFKADAARELICEYVSSPEPGKGSEEIVGKLSTIDYARTILTLKRNGDPAIRMDYPLPLENWLQSNVRKRLKFIGRPRFNGRGDVSSFERIDTVEELEPALEPIDRFKSGKRTFGTNRPLSIPVTVFWDDRLFSFIDPKLGIDVVANSPTELREAVLVELDVLWRHYAMARDGELDSEAQDVAASLRSRFGPID